MVADTFLSIRKIKIKNLQNKIKHFEHRSFQAAKQVAIITNLNKVGENQVIFGLIPSIWVKGKIERLKIVIKLLV